MRSNLHNFLCTVTKYSSPVVPFCAFSSPLVSAGNGKKVRQHCATLAMLVTQSPSSDMTFLTGPLYQDHCIDVASLFKKSTCNVLAICSTISYSCLLLGKKPGRFLHCKPVACLSECIFARVGLFLQPKRSHEMMIVYCGSAISNGGKYTRQGMIQGWI